jgi:hypothetical protein
VNAYTEIGLAMIALAIFGFGVMVRPRRGYRASVKRVNEYPKPPKGPAPGMKR